MSALGLKGLDLNKKSSWFLKDDTKGLRSEPSMFDKAYLLGKNHEHIEPNYYIIYWINFEIDEVWNR